MRALSLVLALGVAVPSVRADEKSEKLAKDALGAFLKAVKEKDTDKVMKTVAAPFAHKDGGAVEVIEDEKKLKKWIKDRLGEIDAEKVPTEFENFQPFEKVKENITDEDDRKKVEKVVGKEGYVATVSVDGKTVVVVARVKDGKAAVVGVGR
jgi:hypothetical protein